MSEQRSSDPTEDGATTASGRRSADGRLVLTAALRVASGSAGAGTADTDLPEQSDDSALREAALREIVRDILREELAGPLGERITRGVRKLVRAELALLLAARDPDQA